MNGKYIKNPISKAVVNSLIANAGINVVNGILSLVTSFSFNQLISTNNFKSFSRVCFNINSFNGFDPLSIASS